MQNKLKVLCLILARGGSMRIPGKNIKKFLGKPLLAYAIECAKKSKYINRIIVSTNSKEIAAVARKFGAEIPFLRPPEISKGDSKEIDAFKHALKWLKENENYEPDIIVKLFATSPFRTSESADKAIELLLRNPKADCVRSVTMCSEHPYKMWLIDKNRLKHLISFKKKYKEAHTWSYQILPKVYIQNAAIDIIKPSNIWKKNSITGKNIIPFVMDAIESIDINNPIDFEFANFITRKRINKR
jgi:N-acylneuraminate cytidylyltransferase